MTQLTKGIFTDHSIASLSGASQAALAADPERQCIIIHNPSAVNALTVGIGVTAVANTAGTITIVGSTIAPLILDAGIPTQAIFVRGAAGQAATIWTYP